MRGPILIAAALAAAPTQSPVELRFIACPIYRDTDAGKKSGCWLVDDKSTATRYDISQAPTKPDWHRAVLVEGQISTATINANITANPCGGTVLEPIRVSLLPYQCRPKMLPADGFSGRKYVLPARNVRPLYAPHTPPSQPYTTAHFTIPFDFNSSFITYLLSDYYGDQAVAYALDTGAKHIDITGYADTHPRKISGHILRENGNLAQIRAEKLRDWFVMRGVPADRIQMHWQTATTDRPSPATDNLSAPSRRRVDINITPVALNAP